MRHPDDHQVLWVPFRKGVDQSTDETARPVDVPTALLDVEQHKASQWGTRRGFARLTRAVDYNPWGTPSKADSLRSLFSTGGDDAELCMVTDHFLLALNEEAEVWNERGPVSPFALRQESVYQDDFSYTSGDLVVCNGYTMKAAIRDRQNSSGTTGTDFTSALVVTITDTDGGIILPYEITGETSTIADKLHSVHCTSRGGAVMAALAQKGLTGGGAAQSVVGAEWNTESPTTSGLITSLTSLVTDVWQAGEGRRVFDIVPTPTGSRYWFAYIENASQNIELLELRDSFGTTGIAYTLSTDAPYRRLSIAADSENDRILVLAQTEPDGGEPYGGSEMHLYSINIDAGSITYNATVASLSEGISHEENSDDLGVVPDYDNDVAVCTWTRTRSGSLYSNDYVSADNISRDLAAGTANDTLERTYNARFVSKPWIRDGRAYAHLATMVGLDVFDGTNGAFFSLFGNAPLLSPWDVNWVADLRHSESGGRPAWLVGLFDVGLAPNLGPNRDSGRGCGNGNNVWNVLKPDGTATGDWRFMSHRAIRQVSGQADNIGQTEIRCDFDAAITWAQVHGGAVAIGGGIVSWYDGYRVAELGHAVSPVMYSVTENASGGSFTDGDYQWVPVWYWVDGRGFVHRSAPGPPIEETVDNGGGADNASVTLTVRTNPATNRFDAPGVSAVFFRGEDDANYKRSSPPMRVVPNYESSYKSEDYEDTNGWERAEILYTQSGELEAVAPEAARVLAMVNRRLWLGDMARWFNIQYSKPPDAGAVGALGLAPEFNETLMLQLERAREVTGIGALDDKVVVFTEGSIYLVAGQGPLDNGLQSDFSDLTLVNGNVGCIEARSVVEVPGTSGFPGGLFFQSEAGIYLLDRGTGLTFIGAPVEDDTDAMPVVTSASHDRARQLVLFTVTDADRTKGAVLVYDYESQAWSKWRPRRASGAYVVPVAGCMHRGRFYVGEEDGQVWQQNAATDSRAYYDDATQWVNATIETADVFGGQAGGWHRLARFVPVVERTEPGQATVGLRVTTVTDGEEDEAREFSATMVGDWVGHKVPIEVRPARHKCHSMRLRLESIEGPDADSGQGLLYSGVLVHTRPRPTPARVGTARRT